MVQLPGIVSFGYVIFDFLSVYFTADVKTLSFEPDEGDRNLS